MTSSSQQTTSNNSRLEDSDNDARDEAAYRLALLSLLTATENNNIEDDSAQRLSSTKRTNAVRQQARPRSVLRSRPGSRVPPKCQDPSDMFGLITSLLEGPSLEDVIQLAEEDLSSMTADEQELSSIDALVDMYMPGLPEDEMDYYRRRSCPFMRANDDVGDGK